jgi:predicted transcriptional regulator
MALWAERDYPIIEAVAALEAAGEYEVTVGSIAETVGRDVQDTWIGLRSLEQAGYIDWTQNRRRLTAQSG